ncbi:MAG: MerR family transcriptional regulator [Lactovum sp.]
MTISEVSERSGISLDTLRYYEKIGLIPKIRRNSSGQRDYQEADLEHLNFISCMKKAGCSLEVIKDYITLYQLGEQTVDERLKLLENQKKILLKNFEELKSSLNFLDYKIEITKEKKEKYDIRKN